MKRFDLGDTVVCISSKKRGFVTRIEQRVPITKDGSFGSQRRGMAKYILAKPLGDTIVSVGIVYAVVSIRFHDIVLKECRILLLEKVVGLS